MKHCLHLWVLVLVLVLVLVPGAVWATAGLPAAGHSLAEALNPDGTLKAGAAGSFDARAFRMRTAPDGRPVFRVAGAGDARWADGFALGNGASGTVRTVVRSGSDIYVGGYFKSVGNVAANNVAKWNGTTWSSLGAGITTTGQTAAPTVYALAVAGNGDVYAGGFFTQAGGVAANSIAKWNGTAWSSLGAGVTQSSQNPTVNVVYALVIAGNGDVYAGGDFTQAGSVAATDVAKWNGTAWSSLGTDIGGSVYALAVDSNGEVYAGGSFTQSSTMARKIAKWNGTAWSSLGTGVNTAGTVYAVAFSTNGEVYAGGYIQAAGGMSANNIAKWNGTAWSLLGATSHGLNGDISAVVVAGNGEVYVGGAFLQADGITVNNIAKWNGTAWSGVGTGFDGPVYVLALSSNGDLYAGGIFAKAGATTVNGIAKWNGTAWSSLGTGVHTSVANRAYAAVLTIAISSSGEVYAGGVFGYAGSEASNNIAKWNGTAWSSMAFGTDTFGSVYAVAIAGNGDVYAGGKFTGAGTVTSKFVARWNGTAWSGLGAGNDLNGNVNTLAVADNGDLYAGGSFTRAGGTAASRIAQWNGTGWSSLGTGGGNGLDGVVYTMAVASNGDVYAGGDFTQAGGQSANNVAKWNGAGWSSLGTGLNSSVSDVATGPLGKLYAVGYFTATGDGSKAMAHFAIYDPAAPLATTATRATPAGQLFPNPARGTATLRLPAGAARQPLTLHDALGRLVRQYPAPAGPEAVLDLRGLPAGVYLVRCGQLSQRLVVE